MIDFKQLLKAFETKVREVYDPLVGPGGAAENVDYYVFQTTARPKPQLLVMGINPGGDCKNGTREGTGNSEKIYNAYFDGDDHPWFQTLRAIFGTPMLTQQLRDCVGTNEYFINTGNAKKLPKDKDFKRQAVRLARELVEDVIRPERIVALGSEVFQMLKHSPLLTKQFGSVTLNYAHRGDIPVCFVPNPSGYNRNRYFTPAKLADWHVALEWFLTETK